MELDQLTDVTYEVDRGLAWITINRPDVYNAFRGRTVDELIRCVKAAWADRAVGVVALTGAGDKAFCAGGDQKQRAETGDIFLAGFRNRSVVFLNWTYHYLTYDLGLRAIVGPRRREG